MYASIVCGRVAALYQDPPVLGPREGAIIVEVFDWDCQPGWMWTPEGCCDCCLDDKLIGIDDKYNRQLSSQRDLLVIAQAEDGGPMESRLSTIRAKYQRIIAARDAEIAALLEE